MDFNLFVDLLACFISQSFWLSLSSKMLISSRAPLCHPVCNYQTKMQKYALRKEISKTLKPLFCPLAYQKELITGGLLSGKTTSKDY